MKPLLLNILLAFVWTALAGEMTGSSFFVGFALGYALLSLQHQMLDTSTYYSKPWQLTVFLAIFFAELLSANIRVAIEVLSPRTNARPGVIAVPLDAETDFEITLLSVAISLTPGTLSLDVSQDHKTLFIHSMFVDDPDAVRSAIKNGLERRLLDLMR